MGLLDAKSKFNPEANVSFKDYAVIRISGAILDGMRGMFTGSRQSVLFRKKVEIAKSKLNTHDSAILANALAITLDEFHKKTFDAASYQTITASVLSGDSEEGSPGDFDLVVFTDGAIESELLIREFWEFANKFCNKQEFLTLKLLCKYGMQNKDAAKVLNVSEGRVAQIVGSVVAKGKSYFSSKKVIHVKQKNN